MLSDTQELAYRKPKKVIYTKIKELRAKCPSCNRRLKTQSSYAYCPGCGQKLDWNVGVNV